MKHNHSKLNLNSEDLKQWQCLGGQFQGKNCQTLHFENSLHPELGAYAVQVDTKENIIGDFLTNQEMLDLLQNCQGVAQATIQEKEIDAEHKMRSVQWNSPVKNDKTENEKLIGKIKEFEKKRKMNFAQQIREILNTKDLEVC